MCVPLFRGKSVLVVHEMPLGGEESVCVVCCVVWMCGRCVDVCGCCVERALGLGVFGGWCVFWGCVWGVLVRGLCVVFPWVYACVHVCVRYVCVWCVMRRMLCFGVGAGCMGVVVHMACGLCAVNHVHVVGGVVGVVRCYAWGDVVWWPWMWFFEGMAWVHFCHDIGGTDSQ